MATATEISILRSAGKSNEILPLLDREVAGQDNFQTRLMRGGYLAKIGQLQQADADFEKLPQLNSEGQGQVLLAQHYLATGRATQAADVLAQGLAQYPANVTVKEQYIRLLLDSPAGERRQEAMAMLEDLITQKGDDPQLRVIQGRAILAQNDSGGDQKAESMLRDIAHRYPLMLEAHLALARAMADRGDFAAMQQAVSEGLRSNGDSIPLLLQAAAAQEGLGNRDGARDMAAVAIRTDPSSSSARAYAVQLAMRHGDKKLLAEQLAGINSVLAVAPDDENLQITRSVALEELGQKDQALASLQGFAASPYGSQSRQTQLSLCRMHRSAGRLDQAQQCLDRAAAILGEQRPLLVERIRLLGAQSAYSRVIEIMNGLPQDWPADEQVIQTLATVLQAGGRPEHVQALRQWCGSLIQRKQPLSVRYCLANVTYSCGDCSTAQDLYEDLYRRAPKNPNVLNDLAWILVNGKADEPQIVAPSSYRPRPWP